MKTLDHKTVETYVSAIMKSCHILSDWAGESVQQAETWEKSVAAGFSEKATLDLAEMIAGGGEDSSTSEKMVFGSKLQPIFTHLNGKTLLPQSSAGPSLSKEEICNRLQTLKEEITSSGLSDRNLEPLFLTAKRLLSDLPAVPGTKASDDYSLFDKTVLSAALSACIRTFESNHPESAAWNKEEKLDSKMFLLYSCDFSGIQNFIFQVADSEAKRSLRARSFYLELLMEHFVDSLLLDSGLCRANLLYAGGGHCCLLLPNTKEQEAVLSKAAHRENEWLHKKFGPLLFLASAWVPCNGRSLMNLPEGSGSYAELFRSLSHQIGLKKMQRYSAEELISMNRKVVPGNSERECAACGVSAELNEEGKCPLCAAFADFSKEILRKDCVFSVTRDRIPHLSSLPLPGKSDDVWLTAVSEQTAANFAENEKNVLRFYPKSREIPSLPLSWPIDLGDYCSDRSSGAFAEKAEGISRVGVLRMDVDNLGAAFLRGFDEELPDGKTVSRETLFRTAAFSRELTRFFKREINGILQAGHDGAGYQVEIVYSGGDDVFLTGSWNDVIAAAETIRSEFLRFSLGKLTISAGIGIFGEKYPLYNAAGETAVLVEAAKARPRKDSVCLFAPELVFSWQDFTGQIMKEKLAVLNGFFEGEDSRGNSFLYRLMQLLREQEGQPVNLARYAYVLARLEPSQNSPSYSRYSEFSKKMYHWAFSAQDRAQLITAIYLYFYSHRQKRKGEDKDD